MIMKTTAILSFFVLGALFVFSQEKIYHFDAPHMFRATFVRDNFSISYCPGEGRGGGAYRIQCPADRAKRPAGKQGLGFHVDREIEVKSAAAPIKMSVWLKGRGCGSFGILTRGKDKVFFYPPRALGKFTVDSPGKWVRIEHEFTPAPDSEYTAKVWKVLPYIGLHPGSELLADDLEFRFVTAPQK